MGSRAEDLTLNHHGLGLHPRSGIQVSSYTVHTTHLQSRDEDLTLMSALMSAVYTVYTHTHSTNPVAVEQSPFIAQPE